MYMLTKVNSDIAEVMPVIPEIEVNPDVKLSRIDSEKVLEAHGVEVEEVDLECDEKKVGNR